MAERKRRKILRGTSGLVHARPGAGKSTLLHSMRPPRLIHDAESGDVEFPIDDLIILDWDDYDWHDEVPDLSGNVSVVKHGNDYWDYREVVDYIRQDRRRLFRSFGIDSLTRVQRKMEDDMNPLDTRTLRPRRRDYDHFDALLNHMMHDLEILHELTITRGLHTWWICHSDREVTPIRPNLVGQLRKKIAEIPDVVGYLKVEEGLDDEGNDTTWRVLDISPSTDDSLVETKCRRYRISERWGDEIVNPNLARIGRVASPRPKKARSK